MGSRNGWTLLALAAPPALALACSQAEAPTLAEFSRAQAVRFDLAGTWSDERATIRIHSTGEGEFVIFGRAPDVIQEGDTHTEQTLQGWERAGVLCVHPSFDGFGALYPCLIGGEPMLLPDVGVTLEGDPPMPRGRAFRRIEELPLSPEELDSIKGYLPGPEDENYPSPWREVYGGG
ncbi:MAG TPA: hypothetical protein VF530_06490 [Planctomycetota bacterium]